MSYAASSLLGRALRSANWTKEREIVEGLAESVSEDLEGNNAVEEIAEHLTNFWSELHKGTYYADPSVSFECDEMEKLLRHLSIGFSPGHLADKVPFSRLSDGQKSLLYLSLVLTIQGIGRSVLAKKSNAFDVDKFRPAIFTMIAMEEPENSLSPHYLGRVIKALTAFANFNDGQSVIATHAPSMLKRVAPEQIRYLRLDEDRQTVVKSITIPDEKDEAHKFVREAVQALPELYFSRVVILGEGIAKRSSCQEYCRPEGLDTTTLSSLSCRLVAGM